MSKKLFLRISFLSFACFLLFLSACGTVSQGSAADAPVTGTPTGTTTSPTATPTQTSFTSVDTPNPVITPTVAPEATPASPVSQGDFAAFVGNSGSPIVQVNEQEYGNSTTIHSAVDRPAAFITQPYLSVPPQAKGQVLIQNDSANPQTLVSDTPNGFASFTIAPYTTTTLVFTRAGSFRSHLQNYSDVTLTIFISAPYS